MALKEFFDKVGDSAREAAENMAQGVNDVAKDVKHGIDEAADGVKQGVNEAADGIKKGANKVAQGIQQGVNQAVEGVKQSANQAGEGVAQFAQNKVDTMQKNSHNPVMLKDFKDEFCGRPIMVRIDRENKYRNERVFKDAVGYKKNASDKLTVLNIYHDKIQETGVKLIPNSDDLLYYKHPCLPDTYISLETYFEYLKKACVSELERVGYDLGAKHIKIVFKENKKKNVEKKFKDEVNIHGKIPKMKGDFNHKVQADFHGKNDADFEVALNVKLGGNDHPCEPALLFYKDDTDINTLIHMRLNPENQLNKKTYTFAQNKVFSMSMDVATQIDLLLKKLNCKLNFSGNASFKSKSEEEDRTILEYTIEF